MDDLENAVDYAVASLVGEQVNSAPEEVGCRSLIRQSTSRLKVPDTQHQVRCAAAGGGFLAQDGRQALFSAAICPTAGCC